MALEARAIALSALARRQAGPVVAVVSDEREAEDLAADISLFCGEVVLIPAWETLPFERLSPNQSTMARRCRAIHALSDRVPGQVLVASVRAATQRLSPSDPTPLTITRGESIPLQEVVGALASLGFERVVRVEAPGEMAVRGGIVDVYPAADARPTRLDYWGDEVEEIRHFSPATQRSDEHAEQAVFYPARELRPDERVVARARELLSTSTWGADLWERLAQQQMFEGMESWMPWLAAQRCLLDHLDSDTLVVVADPPRSIGRSRTLLAEEEELAGDLSETWSEAPRIAKGNPRLYLSLEEALSHRPVLEMPSVPVGPSDEVLAVRTLAAAPGDGPAIAATLSRLRTEQVRVVVAIEGAAAADRWAGVLAEENLAIPRRERLTDEGSVIISHGIRQGFILDSPPVAVLGERELAGRHRAHRTSRRRRKTAVGIRDLSPGDYVVHYQHGIGRFEGLVSESMAGVERDYLLVAYAGDDRLYVPVDQLSLITRYTGGEAPRLSRMGGKDWAATRERVRNEVQVVAEEVVALHRARSAATGYSFNPDTPWQQELEAAFPYEETSDQLEAIAEVKADMESDRPMDRLIFGDVGFGKTEVAVRAAFKAVMDRKQVAVLCPTTILAQQHHQTFTERLSPHGVEVAVLSRFLTSGQARKVVARLASGEVDVVVGTHRLLSKDVRFRDLGLLVVDEEQRFGVAAKDALRLMKVGVDVLTLTATPIPRTLEMALTGIRDVSHIRIPPRGRRPILTYVGPYDEQAVSMAIRRELLREGQVFYVHNRVLSIDHAVARLSDLVPRARFAVAHGQMSEAQLEQVMIDYWDHRYDVLVSTTIIESGLDLPQVNTLVVERADRIGLSQLYQLRGRVGRSHQRAYAYLFHPVDRVLSESAHRRLQAIGRATHFGAGFDVAFRDLEIRGAGSILSQVQSGHLQAVGLDLYTELVAEAVGELEGRPVGEESETPSVRIDLAVDAHLPEGYISEQALRLEAYRWLAAAVTAEQVEDVVEGWEDRYGPPPPQALALAEVAALRVECLRVGISEIMALRGEVRLSGVDLRESQRVRAQRLARGSSYQSSTGQLFIPAPRPVLAGVLKFVRRMWPPDGTNTRRMKGSANPIPY
ncbi:MAG: transcription-repair coupling factor [bacterium]|nr:transcription-repair coupling factor [Acidimicrobiia bacterium]MCY4650160.1 transcription-repair coupling factor [bacterium]